MRILAVIPHYFFPGEGGHGSLADDAAVRATALAACIRALHQHLGDRQRVIQIAERVTRTANESLSGQVHVVVLTTQGRHVLDQLDVDPDLYQHYPVDVEPLGLGFRCQQVLRDRWGNYDLFAYLEDDLILHDPWLPQKLRWFNQHLGDECLLMPNRYELGVGSRYHKVYVDGDLRPATTARWQDLDDKPQLSATVMGQSLLFERPRNPHAGCYFLNARQLERWTQQPHFASTEATFIGPLESAATLGVMRTFKIYKSAPANASFLEIQHYGDRFLRMIR